jgi:uncharacterized protein with PIN domain
MAIIGAERERCSVCGRRFRQVSYRSKHTGKVLKFYACPNARKCYKKLQNAR